MEFIAPIERSLDEFINILKLLLETITAICVLSGLIRSTIDAMQLRNNRFYRYIPQLMERVELALDFPVSQTSRSGLAESGIAEK